MAGKDVEQEEGPEDNGLSEVGYYDAETAAKCEEASNQHSEFYTDLEARWEQRHQAQVDTTEKLNAFKASLNPKIQSHLRTFESSD